MKILFEKYKGRERLDAWTYVFENIDEVIKFMESYKEHVLGATGDNYSIRISIVK